MVRRTGKVPGSDAFTSQTGIGKHEWYGRYWPRWSDALIEAGFQPNEKTKPADKETVLAAYLAWVEELGRFPTEGELRVKNHTTKGFPGRSAIRAALGLKADRVRALLEYAISANASERVIEVLRKELNTIPLAQEIEEPSEPHAQNADGFVYLVKSGKNYKVGRTNALDRRQYEIGVQLPEKLEPIHSIATDDPSGIESYWHNRLRDKRLNGEWFRLSALDVRAFKRRKFM